MKRMRLNHSLVFKMMIVTALLLGSWGFLEGQFAGGDGSQNNPWQIETAEHLNNVRNYLGEEHSDKFFIQISNIDLGVAPWNEGEGWEPIGTEGNSFRGHYDGDGHTIYGLYINRAEDDLQGLFGKIYAGSVSNLGLTNVNVTGDSNVGALVALSYNYSRIRNCYGEGRVLGKGDRIGGLVGENYRSLIAGSHFRGTVEGEMSTGGLAGRSFYSTIENCYAAADVNGGSRWVSGLVGKNNFSSIDESFSSGSIKGKEEMIGGLVGKNFSGGVFNSYSIASVEGIRFVGGLVGVNLGYIENCYSTGYVRGDFSFGGLSGPGTLNRVTASYWNPETSGQPESHGGRGLTTSAMTLEESFAGWDFENIWSVEQDVHYPYHTWQETAAPHNYPGPHSLTCSPDNENFDIELNWQMSVGTPLRYNIYRNDNLMDTVDHPITAYLDENIVEDEIITYYVTAVISTPEHGEFETATSNRVTIGPFGKFADGSGSVNNPWQIRTAEQLHNVRYFLGIEHRNKHFIQTADIDLTAFLRDEEEEDYINEGRGWLPIGERSMDMTFSATYNGNSHIIEGLYINRPEEHYLGLFGVIFEAGITNLGLLDIHVEGNNQIGGLIGYDWSIYGERASIIENCYVTGALSAVEDVGGLIGRSSFTWIRNCYTKVNVSGVNNVGGLIGSGLYELTNCYSVGVVEGETNTGGLVGSFFYEVSNSYWDIETSGRETSAGGEGRTTEQMTYPHSENTYVDWDFDEIWKADEDYSVNLGYPYLRGDPTVSIEDDIVVEAPFSTILTNYPNPFNPETVIKFNIKEETDATLSIYNIKGQLVKTLHNGLIKAGEHRLIWDGKNNSGRDVSSGVYFYRLKTDDYEQVNKMLLVK